MKTEEQSIEDLMIDLEEHAAVVHRLCVKISNKENLTDTDYVELANARSILCNAMAFISSKFLNDFCRNQCTADHRDRCIGYFGNDEPKCQFYYAEKET